MTIATTSEFTFVADPMNLSSDGCWWTVEVIDAMGEVVDGWVLPVDDDGDVEDDAATCLTVQGWKRTAPFGADHRASVVRL